MAVPVSPLTVTYSWARANFCPSLLGGREAAVQVIAISMGGVVARDALAWAEDGIRTARRPYIEHYVNTMILRSMPPQQGAQ